MASKDQLVAGLPPAREITAAEVLRARGKHARRLVVLDDDPTGTQSVAELPVLNAWSADDLEWALGTGAAAVYVMTNSRSLSPADAAARNREVVDASLIAADRLGVEVDFVSRSDSTLRGHFPLEPDEIIARLAAAGQQIDGVLIVPAFGDAGRITVGGVHYAGSDEEGYVPVGETEFANDATFGYQSSDLRDWVAEKTNGRIPAEQVVTIDLENLRGDSDAAQAKLAGLTDGAVAVVDIADETDLRSLALQLLAAERTGKRFVYRVGPPFVRGLIGQEPVAPLTNQDVSRIREAAEPAGGLIVVGSHVGLTTRQLNRLREWHSPVELEIDVPTVLGDGRSAHLESIINEAASKLRDGNVVIRTSRTLIEGADGDGLGAPLHVDRAQQLTDLQVVTRFEPVGDEIPWRAMGLQDRKVLLPTPWDHRVHQVRDRLEQVGEVDIGLFHHGLGVLDLGSELFGAR